MLDQLPEDIVREICQYMDILSVRTIAMLNKKYKRLATPFLSKGKQAFMIKYKPVYDYLFISSVVIDTKSVDEIIRDTYAHWELSRLPHRNRQSIIRLESFYLGSKQVLTINQPLKYRYYTITPKPGIIEILLCYGPKPQNIAIHIHNSERAVDTLRELLLEEHKYYLYRDYHLYTVKLPFNIYILDILSTVDKLLIDTYRISSYSSSYNAIKTLYEHALQLAKYYSSVLSTSCNDVSSPDHKYNCFEKQMITFLYYRTLDYRLRYYNGYILF